MRVKLEDVNAPELLRQALKNVAPAKTTGTERVLKTLTLPRSTSVQFSRHPFVQTNTKNRIETLGYLLGPCDGYTVSEVNVSLVS